MTDDQEREALAEALHARIDGDMLLGGGGWGPDGWADDIPHDKARISDLVRWATNAILAAGYVSPERHAEALDRLVDGLHVWREHAEAAEAEVATLRRQVEAVRGLLEPHRSVDAISGRVSEVHPVHIRAKDLRAALEGGKS